jgi:hypothetical protein
VPNSGHRGCVCVAKQMTVQERGGDHVGAYRLGREVVLPEHGSIARRAAVVEAVGRIMTGEEAEDLDPVAEPELGAEPEEGWKR